MSIFIFEPEANEDCDIGTVDNRFRNIYSKNLECDAINMSTKFDVDYVYTNTGIVPSLSATTINNAISEINDKLNLPVITMFTENVVLNFTNADSIATMQSSINALPKDLAGYSLTINFANGTYDWSGNASALTIENFNNGFLYINGNTSETTTTAYNTQAVIFIIKTGQFIISTSNANITVSRMRFVTYNPNNVWNYGFVCSMLSRIQIFYCSFGNNTNIKTYAAGLICQYCNSIDMYACHFNWSYYCCISYLNKFVLVRSSTMTNFTSKICTYCSNVYDYGNSAGTNYVAATHI